MIIQIHQMWPGEVSRAHEFVDSREFKTQEELDKFFGDDGLKDWLDEIRNRHDLSDGGEYEVCNEFAPCVVWTVKASDSSDAETKLTVDAAVALAQL